MILHRRSVNLCNAVCSITGAQRDVIVLSDSDNDDEVLLAKMNKPGSAVQV